MNTIEALQKFGLSLKEAKVYLSCLELGDSTASEISIKSDLPRTLIYDILEKLINLGLVSYAVRNNKKYFRASPPIELMNILKEKQEALKEILPSLEQLQKIKGTKRPKVEVYEGIEGMKTVMNDILRSGAKEFYAYSSSRSSYNIMPTFMEHWHKQRIKLKIIMKVIYNDNETTRKRISQYKESLRFTDYRFMPIKVEYPTATMIYSDKVLLFSFTKDPFVVMIENEDMAENQKKYFKEMWKIAKKY